MDDWIRDMAEHVADEVERPSSAGMIARRLLDAYNQGRAEAAEEARTDILDDARLWRARYSESMAAPDACPKARARAHGRMVQAQADALLVAAHVRRVAANG